MSAHGGHGAHGGRRRPKHEEHEEHENHERWLVTYADMVTLLMVLFIVMFAMSQVDQKKFNELKQGLAAGFGASDSILSGQPSINDQEAMSALGPIAPNLSSQDTSTPEAQMVAEQVAAGMQQQSAQAQQRTYAAATAEVKRLDGVRRQLMAALRAHHLVHDVQTTYDERGLVVSLVSRHVVFNADSAVLTARGQAVVDVLAPVLKDITDPLEIDGHTNQEPVKPKYFASDWDLSSARALTVLTRLTDVFAIPANRLRMAAFGHTKPLIPVSEPHSQEINKRVDIVVLSHLSPETAGELPDAARGLGLPTAGSLEAAHQGAGGSTGAPAGSTAAPTSGTTDLSPDTRAEGAH